MDKTVESVHMLMNKPHCFFLQYIFDPKKSPIPHVKRHSDLYSERV